MILRSISRVIVTIKQDDGVPGRVSDTYMAGDDLQIHLLPLLNAQTFVSVLFLQLRYGSVDCDWEPGQWSMNPTNWQTRGALAFSGFSRLALSVCSVQGRGKFSPSLSLSCGAWTPLDVFQTETRSWFSKERFCQ